MNPKKIKVMCICSFGTATSLDFKTKLSDVFKELNIDAEIVNSSVSTADFSGFDLLVTSTYLKNDLEFINNKHILYINDFACKSIIKKNLESFLGNY